jgi:hypothetical protein
MSGVSKPENWNELKALIQRLEPADVLSLLLENCSEG